MRCRSVYVLLFVLALPSGLSAAEKAQGFIVLNQGAPVYRDADSDRLLGNADKFESMAGYNSTAHAMSVLSKTQAGGWFAEEKNGRVSIAGLMPLKGKNRMFEGWIAKSDVAVFSYECGCGREQSADPCSPFISQSTGWSNTLNWNMCFDEAKAEKVAKLQSASQPSTQAAPAAVPAESVEQRLKKLEDLKKKGLITESEYQKKRAEILNSL